MSDAARLERGLAVLGIELPAAARARLLAFADLLLKWNRVYNLTAIREPAQVVSHHLLDSLAVLPAIEGARQLADIGSGGGLPGIPLAIARPSMRVVSVETVSKKVSFQRQAKIELELGNFSAEQARVENYRPAARFDVVISRAFADLADFVRLAGHLVAPAGCLVAMKGVHPDEELAALPAGFRVVEVRPLQVPELGATRHLIILQPDGVA